MSGSEPTNVVYLNTTDGRQEIWMFPDGTKVTLEVPTTEPPITVKHAVYCFSAIQHQIHTAMLP